jgi:hypothetical protein
MSDLGAVCERVHSNGESVAPAWPHQRRMVRAGLMEKIMSKTNDTSYDVAATSERELTEAELDFVAGGTPPTHYEFYAVGSAYGFGDLHRDFLLSGLY